MHDELAELVAKGIKTATTCPFYAYHSYESEDGKITVGNHYIVFDSREHPVCVCHAFNAVFRNDRRIGMERRGRR
ncbi:ASCH domain-containing protein [Xenorhabdus sp. XENO-10]|uniref:ASCH domain-containing protein n=1 Tax=Xenorhabdus yunnanensis TaxID=3025878 RepID=A0ABT5LCW0_9GAMM|nr:ASCH domain-containing protein [Xenorhabdus yunnanensis]MDC9588937.1 ASCH domain-containing protein [Xenorhabdus yunnanensis]